MKDWIEPRTRGILFFLIVFLIGIAVISTPLGLKSSIPSCPFEVSLSSSQFLTSQIISIVICGMSVLDVSLGLGILESFSSETINILFVDLLQRFGFLQSILIPSVMFIVIVIPRGDAVLGIFLEGVIELSVVSILSLALELLDIRKYAKYFVPKAFEVLIVTAVSIDHVSYICPPSSQIYVLITSVSFICYIVTYIWISFTFFFLVMWVIRKKTPWTVSLKKLLLYTGNFIVIGLILWAAFINGGQKSWPNTKAFELSLRLSMLSISTYILMSLSSQLSRVETQELQV